MALAIVGSWQRVRLKQFYLGLQVTVHLPYQHSNHKKVMNISLNANHILCAN